MPSATLPPYRAAGWLVYPPHLLVFSRRFGAPMNPNRDNAVLRDLSAADGRLALLFVAADYMAVAAIAVLAIAVSHPLATLVAMTCIAGRQMAFLNLVHAAAHHTLFATRRYNDLVDPIVGLPILTFVRPYRFFHLLHHRDIARKSPDRFDYLYEQVPGADAASVWPRVWHVIAKPLLGAAGYGFVKNTVRGVFSEPTLGVPLVAYWSLLVGIFWQAGWLGYLLVYWVAPLVWLFPVFFFWAEMADHHAVRDEARNQAGFFYSAFIKGHEMYHAIHHRYPRIPFYRVRAANECLQSGGDLIEESRGLWDFLRVLVSRRVHPSS